MKNVSLRVRKFGSAALLALVSIIAPAAAFAQSAVEFDPTEVLGIVTDATTFIVAVGLAVLTMLMVAKGIRWARKAG